MDEIKIMTDDELLSAYDNVINGPHIKSELRAELLRRMESPIVQAMRDGSIVILRNGKNLIYAKNHGKYIVHTINPYKLIIEFDSEQEAIDALLG